MQPWPNRMTRSANILGAVLLLAMFAVPVHMLGQSAVFTAPGRAEGAGSPLSIGVAATGLVSDIAVQEGSRVQAGQLLLQLACSAHEADKTLQRTLSLQEGVTVTAARVLEVRRDARIAAAQLTEAHAQLNLLRAGSREEDVRQAKALRDAAAAELDASRARLAQCSVRAPVSGVVLDVLVNRGQFLSLAVPQPLMHIVPD